MICPGGKLAAIIPESDWKKLRSLKDITLQRACDRILGRIAEVAESRGSESHEAYKKIWNIMDREDRQLAEMFDDLKRSTGLFKLALWWENGILTDEELSQFSEETQNKIQFLCDARR
jgi:hypothetical protein